MKIQNNPELKERHRLALQERAALQAQLEVTEDQYKQAVEALLPVAFSDTGASEPAANLLLSLYNSYNYHFPLVDLCRLDLNLIRHALIAIRGRVLLAIEPHKAIDNGDARFAALQEDWKHLHVSRRYNKDGQ